MPNWVYSTVEMEVSNSNIKLLEAMKENGGICRTYKPMPVALKNTCSPVRIVSKKEYLEEQKFNKEYLESIPEGEKHDDWRLKKGITQEMYDNLIESYGHADWYSWASKHWGTKWGDCEFEYEVNAIDDKNSLAIVRWESAWTPIKNELVEEFINDLKSFYGQAELYWEEEQGFGESYNMIDDKLEMTSEWDLPEWGDEDYQDSDGNYYVYLKEDYHKMGEVYTKGFYLEYSIHEPYDKEIHGEIKKVG
jgi:hypothetical protein